MLKKNHRYEAMIIEEIDVRFTRRYTFNDLMKPFMSTSNNITSYCIDHLESRASCLYVMWNFTFIILIDVYLI